MKKVKSVSQMVLLILCALSLIAIMWFNVFVFIDNAKWLNILIYSVLAIIVLCLVWSYFLRLEVLFKISVVSSFLFLFVYFLYFFLTKFGIIDKINSFQDIKDLILSFKGWGIFSYTIINLLQVILIPIPTTLTILAGTAIYGPFIAFLFATIGVLIGSTIAFVLGRYFSKPLLNWIFGKEKIDKYEKILSKRTKLILFLTLFLPFFPDDMICMLAGVTDLKLKDFLWISLIARSTGIATISFFGSGSIIPFNEPWGIVLWSLILIVAITLIILAFKKRKTIITAFSHEKKPKK